MVFGLSLMLVFSLAPKSFSPGTPVFPSPQKPTLANSNSSWNAQTRLKDFLRTFERFVRKEITILLFTSIIYLQFTPVAG